MSLCIQVYEHIIISDWFHEGDLETAEENKLIIYLLQLVSGCTMLKPPLLYWKDFSVKYQKHTQTFCRDFCTYFYIFAYKESPSPHIHSYSVFFLNHCPKSCKKKKKVLFPSVANALIANKWVNYSNLFVYWQSHRAWSNLELPAEWMDKHPHFLAVSKHGTPS